MRSFHLPSVGPMSESSISISRLPPGSWQTKVGDAASAPAEPRLGYGRARPPMRQHVVYGGAEVAGHDEAPA